MKAAGLVRTILLQIVTATIAVLLVSALWADPAAVDRHRQADGILAPRFVAAMNEFQLAHNPNDADHFLKVSAKDKQRWRAAVDAWRELEHAMKEAGY